MTQAELDDAYDQNKYAPNMPQILARFASDSDAVRSRLGVPRRFVYGPGAAEGLDLYCAKAANAPVVFYIHGGAWRSGVAKNHAYAAELFINAGVHFAVLDFINVIEAGGNLRVMAEQLRRALAWIYERVGVRRRRQSHLLVRSLLGRAFGRRSADNGLAST